MTRPGRDSSTISGSVSSSSAAASSGASMPSTSASRSASARAAAARQPSAARRRAAAVRRGGGEPGAVDGRGARRRETRPGSPGGALDPGEAHVVVIGPGVHAERRRRRGPTRAASGSAATGPPRTASTMPRAGCASRAGNAPSGEHSVEAHGPGFDRLHAAQAAPCSRRSSQALPSAGQATRRERTVRSGRRGSGRWRTRASPPGEASRGRRLRTRPSSRGTASRPASEPVPEPHDPARAASGPWLHAAASGSGRRTGARRRRRPDVRAGPAPPSTHTIGPPSSARSWQRGWKRQPEGGFTGLGTSPVRMMRCRRRSGSGHRDRRQERLRCTGAAGRGTVRARSATSTTLPRYITATRSLMCSTTPRLWAMNRYVRPSSRWSCLEQVEHLRLDRHVERGDRLVADDEVRLQDERAGDADALALAAARTRAGSGARGRASGRPGPSSGGPPRGAPRACRGRGSAGPRRCCRRSASAGRATRTGPGR